MLTNSSFISVIALPTVLLLFSNAWYIRLKLLEFLVCSSFNLSIFSTLGLLVSSNNIFKQSGVLSNFSNQKVNFLYVALAMRKTNLYLDSLQLQHIHTFSLTGWVSRETPGTPSTVCEMPQRRTIISSF